MNIPVKHAKATALGNNPPPPSPSPPLLTNILLHVFFSFHLSGALEVLLKLTNLIYPSQ